MTPEQIMEALTRECRDLLEVIADDEINVAGLTAEERNDLVRRHFADDLVGYGIPVEEYIVGLTRETRERVVNEVLSQPEYTGTPTTLRS